MTDDRSGKTEPPRTHPLSPAAQRALDEAAARRKQAEAATGTVAKEVGGPAGPEPTRYGDWEKKGLTSDF